MYLSPRFLLPLLGLLSLSTQSPIKDLQARDREDITEAFVKGAPRHLKAFWLYSIDNNAASCAAKMNAAFDVAYSADGYDFEGPKSIGFKPDVLLFPEFQSQALRQLKDEPDTAFADVGAWLNANANYLAFKGVPKEKLWATNLKKGPLAESLKVYSGGDFQKGGKIDKKQLLEPLELINKQDGKLQKMQGKMTHLFLKNVIHTINEDKQLKAIDSILSLLKKREGGGPCYIFTSEPVFHNLINYQVPRGEFTEARYREMWQDVADSDTYKDVIDNIQMTEVPKSAAGADRVFPTVPAPLRNFKIEVSFK